METTALSSNTEILVENIGIQVPAVVEQSEEVKKIRTDVRFKDDFVAMCQRCGIGSEDLHKCVRCKHTLPPNLHVVVNWKRKTTAPSVSVSTHDISTDVKREISKSAQQVLRSKKRSLVKKIKSETPAKRVKGGCQRGKEHKCLELSSDDKHEGPEESEAKIPKEEEKANVMFEIGPTKVVTFVKKTREVNLTQFKLPPTTDEASTTPEEIRTDVRFKIGFLALCQRCGIGSEDLHRCVRCKHKLPPNLHVYKNWKRKAILEILAPLRFKGVIRRGKQ